MTAFSLTRGGPFYRLARRCRLVAPTGKIRWRALAAIAWLPFALGALVEWLIGRTDDPLVRDPSVHVRLLVVLPLLGVAEDALEARCAEAVEHLRAEHIADPERIDAILGGAERLRDSWLAEAVILVLVLVVGHAWVWGLAGWSGLVAHTRVTFPAVWCFAFALPLLQFVLVRWLWRWSVWTYVLVRLARSALATNALHPDRAAGLKFLSTPIDAFSWYVGALGTLTATTWLIKILDHHTTLQGTMPLFLTFVLVAVVVACGPLMLFSRDLYRARRRDEAAYHELARFYVDDFRRKWIADPAAAEHGPVLGTADIQSLNDLGGSFEKAESTRIFPFGLRAVTTVCAGAAAPMLPVAFATTPITELAMHLGRMLFGAG